MNGSRPSAISSSSDGRLRRRAIFPSSEGKGTATNASESTEDEAEAQEEEQEEVEEDSEGSCTECTTSTANVYLKHRSLICLPWFSQPLRTLLISPKQEGM